MLKSGLIIGVAAFVLAIAGSFVTALVCAPCWSLLTGLVAGYLGGRLDKPSTSNASAKTGAGAGAIAGVGGLVGQVAGSLLNGAMAGPEFGASVARQLGLPASNNPAAFYAGTFGIGCCLGVLALVLMAGLGAVGGLLWYQLSGNRPPQPASLLAVTMADTPALEALNHSIVACERCPRLIAYCRRVALEKRRAYRDQPYWGRPVPGLGDPRARVLMVGLAPGAHGANRTGRMFTGDGSGDFLIPALYRAGFASQPASTHLGDGLTYYGLYLAAAAHCAPPDNKPTPQEIANCRPYLQEHLRLLTEARVILALGRIGFDAVVAALSVIAPRPAFGHGVEYELGRYVLVGSYHPSRQNTQTGRLTAAMLDEVLARVRQLAGTPG